MGSAYHEGGHVLVSLKTTGADPVHKATILPRGNALGITWSVPEEDRFSQRLFELEARLDVLMGGRAAELLIFGHKNVTAGFMSDLQEASKLARRMVMHFGMGMETDNFAPIYLREADYNSLSDHKKDEVDSRIQLLLKDAN